MKVSREEAGNLYYCKECNNIFKEKDMMIDTKYNDYICKKCNAQPRGVLSNDKVVNSKEVEEAIENVYELAIQVDYEYEDGKDYSDKMRENLDTIKAIVQSQEKERIHKLKEFSKLVSKNITQANVINEIKDLQNDYDPFIYERLGIKVVRINEIQQIIDKYEVKDNG